MEKKRAWEIPQKKYTFGFVKFDNEGEIKELKFVKTVDFMTAIVNQGMIRGTNMVAIDKHNSFHLVTRVKDHHTHELMKDQVTIREKVDNFLKEYYRR